VGFEVVNDDRPLGVAGWGPAYFVAGVGGARQRGPVLWRLRGEAWGEGSSGGSISARAGQRSSSNAKY